MILRSGFLYNEFKKIDFDLSKKLWRENKIYLGNGSFIYKNLVKRQN